VGEVEKRQAGLGAVYRRRDGRWEGQIRIRGGPRRSFYAHTRRDAIRKLAEARWALGQGLPVSSGAQPLSAYFGYWLAANRARLRIATTATYALDVRRLMPYLGSTPLRAINPGMIQSTYTSLLKSGLSERSVEQAHTVLHRALKQAMHWGLTSRNPAALVTPPRPVRREMTALTGGQLQRLLHQTEGGRWHPLWVLLGTSGLRKGEALGLSWQDVDLEAGHLIVRRALQRQRQIGLVFVPPKSQRSRRTVYLTDLARRALHNHRQRQEQRRLSTKPWTDSGLVFTNLDGGPLEPGEVNFALTRALAQADLPRVRVHDLRHTTASILLEAGTHPKVVQDLLGHSTIRLTLDNYSHLTPPLHQEAARTMDLVLASKDCQKPSENLRSWPTKALRQPV
jgi:integrase